MADTIKVVAVEGSVLPVERGHGYVGYTQCAADDPEADHVIDGVTGLKRVLSAVDVPNTLYYRRALSCGDLGVPEEPPPAPGGGEGEGEGEEGPIGGTLPAIPGIDNELPGEQPGIDNTLPPELPPLGSTLPVRPGPDNELPGEQPDIDNELPGERPPVGTTLPTRPGVDNELPGHELDNTLPEPELERGV